MDLIQIVVVLIVVGVLLYLVETAIPMDAAIKRIIRIVVIVALCLWLLSAFGLFAGLHTFHVGH